MGRFSFQYSNLLLEFIIQPAGISDYTDSHIILVRCLYTVLKITAQKLHQSIYFILWTVPVLCGKCIHGYIFYAQIMRCFTDNFNILCPHGMSIVSWHSSFLCPASVSIQNNCNMFWNLHLCSPFYRCLQHKRGHGNRAMSPYVSYMDKIIP